MRNPADVSATDPDQLLLLLPPSVREWVPAGDLAHFIGDVVDELDLSAIESVYEEVEVPRAIRRVAPDALAAVPATLARLYRLEIDAAVRSSAAALAEPYLRTLDAIHVATAAGIGADLQAFVSYDELLLQTAGKLGLPVGSPGA